jgi:hypothetical protein
MVQRYEDYFDYTTFPPHKIALFKGYLKDN